MMVGAGVSPNDPGTSQQTVPQASSSISNIDYNVPPPWPQLQNQRRMRGNYNMGQRRGNPMGMHFQNQRYPVPPFQPPFFDQKQRPPWNRIRTPFMHNPENYNNYRFWKPQTFVPPPPLPPPPAGEEENSEEPGSKKKKRSTNGTARPWDKESAEKALALELECQKNAGTNAIVIRFPDPELSKEIVQNFHNSIENVHFQAPCGGRYCFVTLKEGNDVEKVMKDINKIKFGAGYLQAEKKVQKVEESVGPENIDPFTLYVGNLPTTINMLEVKEKFPTATRIDVGFAQKMKYTRYAFVRYSTAEAAFEAYRNSVNMIIASRSIILRFRRHKAPVGPPGQKPPPNPIETKPGEKLTVGAKLKAKKDKAKAEKLAKENELKKLKKHKKLKTDDGSSDDEEVELEKDDDSESENGSDEEDDDDDDDDDEDDDPDDEDDDDDPDDDDMEQYDDDDDDNDDDDMDDLDQNIKDEDDGYDTCRYTVNLDQLTKRQ